MANLKFILADSRHVRGSQSRPVLLLPLLFLAYNPIGFGISAHRLLSWSNLRIVDRLTNEFGLVQVPSGCRQDESVRNTHT